MKDINLVPKRYYQEKIKKRKRILHTAAITASCCIALVLLGLPVYIKSNAQIERDAKLNAMKSTTGYAEMSSQYNTLKELYKKREEEAKRLKKYGFNAYDILEKVKNSIPEKTTIKSLSIKNSDEQAKIEISLNGIAENEEIVSIFIQNLKKNNNFDPVLDSITKSEQKKSSNGADNSNQQTSDSLKYCSFAIKITITN